MTTLSLDRHDNLAGGVLRRAATAVLDTDRTAVLTVLRVVLGLVILPHGLQKTIGAFGGHGFTGTMGFFGSIGIPAFLAFLVIAAESAGAVALVAGFTTRIAAFGVFATMVVAGFMHTANGFFMNWSGTQKGEGFEFHLLAAGIALVLVIAGGGSASIDRLLARKSR